MGSAVALVLLAAVETIRPTFLGLTPRIAYSTVQTAPDVETVALFDEAAGLGSRGPILALPVRPRNLIRASSEVLLAAYHWRRTSACYNFSHFPQSLRDVARQLPDPDAIRALMDLGFTTLALQHGANSPNAIFVKRRLDAATQADSGDRLERLVGNETLTLYRLVAAGP